MGGEWNNGFIQIAEHIIRNPDIHWKSGSPSCWGNDSLLKFANVRNQMRAADIGVMNHEVLYRYGAVKDPWYMLTLGQVTYWETIE